MRVLFVTSEIAPWIKTGGLADVSAALPDALHALGVDVRVLVPAYPALWDAFADRQWLCDLPRPGGKLAPARLFAATSPSGVPLILLDCPQFYARDGGPYVAPWGEDWPDNHLRFALLSRTAALLASGASPLQWQPEILHVNDWQSALAPAYLRYTLERRAAAVTTVHNAAFQGVFPADTLDDLALPPEAFVIGGVEYYGQVSFLKGGLQLSDWLTTVSPTYAAEIQTAEFGFGLEGLLRHRSDRLAGILNGIDTALWDPAGDRFLPQPYDAEHLEGKAAGRAALQQRFGLPLRDDVPLFAVVSRLTHQKGLDMVAEVAEALIGLGAQLVVVGSGERELQQAFLDLARDHPQHVGTFVGFDEGLAHLAEAGADIFLMPSRFEPCGLNQMYSLRYGTPPIVRRTGGLADTVTDCNAQTLAEGSANGFVFGRARAVDLLAAAYRALETWRDRPRWRTLQRNGMRADFGWHNAAQQYVALYQRALA